MCIRDSRYGARASIEIFHAGQYARVKDHAWGPCSLIREDGVEVKALDSAEMERIAGLFAEAAQQAKTLGFDAIFLHFGHGWLAGSSCRLCLIIEQMSTAEVYRTAPDSRC